MLEPVRCQCISVRHEVAVDVDRCLDTGVSQTCLNDVYGHTCSQQETGVSVAEIVEPDTFEPTPICGFPECLAECVRRQNAAVCTQAELGGSGEALSEVLHPGGVSPIMRPQ